MNPLINQSLDWAALRKGAITLSTLTSVHGSVQGEAQLGAIGGHECFGPEEGSGECVGTATAVPLWTLPMQRTISFLSRGIRGIDIWRPGARGPLQVAKKVGQDAFNLELMVQWSAKINFSTSTYFILKKNVIVRYKGNSSSCRLRAR